MNSQNTDILKTKELIRSATEIETGLQKIIPQAFINFFDIPEAKWMNILEISENYVSSQIDTTNKQITDAIKKYSEFSYQIENFLKEFHPFYLQRNSSFIHDFIVSQYSLQQARFLLLKFSKPIYEAYMIISASVNEMRGMNEIEIEHVETPAFRFGDFLKINGIGEIDIEETMRIENSEMNIRAILSSAGPSIAMKENLYFELSNHSRYAPFAILNKSIAKEMCAVTASIICESYAKLIYENMSESNTLDGVKDLTNRAFQKNAITYLHSGQDTYDEMKLGESIFRATGIILEKIDIELEPKLKQSICLELLRIGFNIILEKQNLPSEFFDFTIRQASAEERLSPEVTQAMDVYMIDNSRKLIRDIWETYIFRFPSAQLILAKSVAANGVKNGNFITSKIESYSGLSSFQKFRNNILEKIDKLENNE